MRLHAAGELDGREVEHLGPPPHGHAPVLGVDPDREAGGTVPAQQPLDQRRVGRGLGANHDAGGAPGEHLLYRLRRAQAAAHLHFGLGRREQAPRQLAVVAGAEGAVEIDEVQPARAGCGERLGDGDGIVGVGGGVRGLALAQPHDPPALHVNGGVELHGCEGN